MLRLVKLELKYQQQLNEMMDEWTASKEKIIPWSIRKCDYHNFETYLNALEEKKESEENVPDSTFFCLDTKRNIFVGAVNIRHYLNEKLLLGGGHIGDGIRPSERGKGYGTKMIALALEECRKLGIDRVLMCCDKDNPASAKTIIKNRGVLENEVMDEGSLVQRYWIEINTDLFTGRESICNYLKERDIPYEITEHKAVRDMGDLYSLNLPYPECTAKNLLIRDGKRQNYYLLTIKQNKKIDLKGFRKQNKLSALSFAYEAELDEILGVSPGAVGPLGILNDTECRVHFYMDDEFKGNRVGVHPNENTATLWTSADDLLNLIQDHGNIAEYVRMDEICFD